MIVARRLLLAGLPLAALVGCRDRDPRIGLELVYQSVTPAAILQLWFDETAMLGGQAPELHVSPHGPAQEARFMPPGRDPIPALVRAHWRYQAVDPVDEAAFQSLPDARLPWREARGSVPLRERMSADSLGPLLRAPDRHRLRLVLLFDRAWFGLRWQVRQWR